MPVIKKIHFYEKSEPLTEPSLQDFIITNLRYSLTRATLLGCVWYKYERYKLVNLSSGLLKDYVGPLAAFALMISLIKIADKCAITIIGPRPDSNEGSDASTPIGKRVWTLIINIENTAYKMDERASDLLGIRSIKEVQYLSIYEESVLEVLRGAILKSCFQAPEIIEGLLRMEAVDKLFPDFLSHILNGDNLELSSIIEKLISIKYICISLVTSDLGRRMFFTEIGQLLKEKTSKSFNVGLISVAYPFAYNIIVDLGSILLAGPVQLGNYIGKKLTGYDFDALNQVLDQEVRNFNRAQEASWLKHFKELEDVEFSNFNLDEDDAYNIRYSENELRISIRQYEKIKKLKAQKEARETVKAARNAAKEAGRAYREAEQVLKNQQIQARKAAKELRRQAYLANHP